MKYFVESHGQGSEGIRGQEASNKGCANCAIGSRGIELDSRPPCQILERKFILVLEHATDDPKFFTLSSFQ